MGFQHTGICTINVTNISLGRVSLLLYFFLDISTTYTQRVCRLTSTSRTTEGTLLFTEPLWCLRVFGVDIAPVVVVVVVVVVDRMLMIKPLSFAMLPLTEQLVKQHTQIWFIMALISMNSTVVEQGILFISPPLALPLNSPGEL